MDVGLSEGQTGRSRGGGRDWGCSTPQRLPGDLPWALHFVNHFRDVKVNRPGGQGGNGNPADQDAPLAVVAALG